MGSQIYAKPLNPGDKIDDGIIEELNKQKSVEENGETKPEENKTDEKTLEDILSAIPEIKDIKPITEWKKYFQDKDFTKGNISNALQFIKNIKTTKVGSDNTAHEIPNNLINLPEDINEFSADLKKTKEEKCNEILLELEYLPKQVLNYTFRQVTVENLTKISSALNWLLKEKFEIQSISTLLNEDSYKIDRLHLVLPRVLEDFNKPEMVMGIVEDKNI